MMSLYSLILIIHVLAVFVMAGILSIEALSLTNLRRSSTSVEVSPWINPVPMFSVVAGLSILVILLTGAHLVAEESAWQQSWPKVAASSLLLMAPVGAMTGKRMRAIRRAFSSKQELTPELFRQLRDPFLKASLGLRAGTFLGIFLLVSTKPGLSVSICLVIAAALLGLLASFLVSRSRNPTLLAARANQ
jgi:hypothetical protein